MKLFSWPSSAIPDGPIKIAANFTLIKLVNIFTKVETEISEKTLRKSNLYLFMVVIIKN
jgi:hypothetical protein